MTSICSWEIRKNKLCYGCKCINTYRPRVSRLPARRKIYNSYPTNKCAGHTTEQAFCDRSAHLDPLCGMRDRMRAPALERPHLERILGIRVSSSNDRWQLWTRSRWKQIDYCHWRGWRKMQHCEARYRHAQFLFRPMHLPKIFAFLARDAWWRQIIDESRGIS